MTLADVLNKRPGLQRRLHFLARRFVAGETVDSAAAAVRKLNEAGMSGSVDFLGEDVLSEAEAANTVDVYIDLVGRIVAENLDTNISVKLSAIGQAISEDLALANLRRIAAAARPTTMFIRLDMEGSPTVESTYRILDRARADYPHIGPVVQAYLHRATGDVEHCVREGLRVRLCKGAYREPPSIALQQMRLIRLNYLRLAERLLSDGAYPGIATHDERLITAVKQFAASRNAGRDRFEFQMLYGVRPHLQGRIVADGYRLRVYVPFGTHWAGYFYRRVAERKENLWFALRSMFSR